MKNHIRHNIRRLALCTIVTAMLISVLSIFTFALTPTSKMSDKYKTSRFYSNLVSLELTSDDRTNVIMVAMSQLGYHEGSSEADFDGLNTNSSGNYTEYCYLYGKVDGDGDGTAEYGYAWCAAFVSWCLRQAGISTTVAKSYVSCTNWVTWFKNNSTYKTRASGYTPKPGDIIFFKDATASRASTHVGIVRYVDSGKVYTIEGNSGGAVKLKDYELTNTYIVGYGVPSYKNNDTSTRIDYSHSNTPLGTYITSASSLNVRQGPSTSYSSLGQLPIGTTVQVLEFKNNWCRIVYKQKEAWISASYVHLVCPEVVKTVTLTFDLCGGAGYFNPITVKSGETVGIPMSIPTKTGYDFLGWSISENGTVNYTPEDTIRLSEDRKLYAVWKTKVYTVTFYDYDNSVILTKQYEHGAKIKTPENPKRAQDANYTYTFKGWSGIVSVATKNESFYALYDATPLPPETNPETKPEPFTSFLEIITEFLTEFFSSEVPSDPPESTDIPFTENTTSVPVTDVPTESAGNSETVQNITETESNLLTEIDRTSDNSTDLSEPTDSAPASEKKEGCAGTIDGIISVLAIISFAVVSFKKKKA